MGTYVLEVDGECDTILFDDSVDSLELSASLDGRAHGRTWRSLPVRISRGRISSGNFLGLYLHSPVIDEHAKQALAPALGSSVEFLPLSCKTKELYILNVLTILDALDLERSDLELNEENESISDIRRFAFRADVIEGHPIFKLKDFELSWILVSDDVRQLVERSGLKGATFRPAEQSPERRRNRAR